MDGECRASEIIGFCCAKRARLYTKLLAWPDGEVPEWLNGAVSKTVVRASVPRVRTSLSASQHRTRPLCVSGWRASLAALWEGQHENFADKVAVISGGANGIGLDIGKCLAAEKCHVVIADIDQAACDRPLLHQRFGHDVEVVGMACDVTDKDQITALADKAWAHFGHVDILFNNAGVGVGLKAR